MGRRLVFKTLAGAKYMYQWTMITTGIEEKALREGVQHILKHG